MAKKSTKKSTKKTFFFIPACNNKVLEDGNVGVILNPTKEAIQAAIDDEYTIDDDTSVYGLFDDEDKVHVHKITVEEVLVARKNGISISSS